MPIAAIWGANGFIGRHLAHELIKNGWEINALVRKPCSFPEEFNRSIKQHVLSFASSVDEISEALKNVQVVYHCAGSTDHGADADDFVLSVERFMGSAIRCNVGRVILLSTVAVYGKVDATMVTSAYDPKGKSSYALARIAAENILARVASNKQIKAYIVRIPMVIGPGMPSLALKKLFTRLIYGGRFFHPGSRMAVLNCIGIEKLCCLLLKLSLFQSAKNVSVFQFSDNIKWLTIVDLYAKLTGKSIVRIYIPTWGLKIFHNFTIFEKISVLNNQIHFSDDTFRLLDKSPETLDDISRYIESLS